LRREIWYAIILTLIIVCPTNVLSSPLKVYKFVTRYYKVSPTGEVEGTTSVKLDIRGNGNLFIEDNVMFIDPSSITLVGNTVPPSDVNGDELLTKVTWEVSVKKSLILHYQAKSSIRVIDGYCYVSVNSKPVNFTRVRGTFLVKAKEEDLINITYVVHNSIPLFISKNGTLFKAVLPAVLTLSFDETKLVVEEVDPKPNISSKLGSSKILVWFVLLRDELTVSVLVRVRSLGPWKEIRVEPLNVKVDFSVEKYVERIDSTVEELERQLDEIEEYLRALNKTLDFYKDYSTDIGNATEELKELGLFLKDNASKAFMRQYHKVNYYKDKLEELARRISSTKENVSQVIALLEEIKEEIGKAEKNTENATRLLNFTRRLTEFSKKYNMSNDLISTYLSIVKTLISSLNSSRNSADLIIAFINNMQRLLEASYEKVEDLERLLEKLITEVESYSELQYYISNSLYSLGVTLVNMSKLIEQTISEFNDTVRMYEEKVSSLKDKEASLREVIDDLTETKMGLMALKYVELVESHVFTEAGIKLSYNQSTVIFEFSEVSKESEASIHEALEVDIGSFHITGIDVDTTGKGGIPKKGSEVPVESNAVYFLILFTIISLILVVLLLARKLKKRAHDELLNRIEELIQLIEKELEKE